MGLQKADHRKGWTEILGGWVVIEEAWLDEESEVEVGRSCRQGRWDTALALS